MAAGVTDRLFDVSDVAALLNAEERGAERAAPPKVKNLIPPLQLFSSIWVMVLADLANNHMPGGAPVHLFVLFVFCNAFRLWAV
jgi:hypothetical protein